MRQKWCKDGLGSPYEVHLDTLQPATVTQKWPKMAKKDQFEYKVEKSSKYYLS